MTQECALEMVVKELDRARALHSSMKSPHEGYSVILEEMDELWADVKARSPDHLRLHRMRTEATQVAAMALRFLIDLT